MNATQSRLQLIIGGTLLILFACVLTTMAEDAQVPMIGVDQLDKMLGRPDVMIIDVRAPADWASAGVKIAGAVRKDPKDIDSWVGELPKDKDVVLYCA
jgi:phage shock protein E